MSFTTEHRSYHQIVADENPAAMLASCMAQAAMERARHEQEMADWRAMVAATERDPLSGHLIDPSAGMARKTFYECLRARGE